jgi:hypothetical protein
MELPPRHEENRRCRATFPAGLEARFVARAPRSRPTWHHKDPAECVRLAFKLFDSEGVALVNLLSDGSGALEEMRDRARDLGIVLDEALVRDAERAQTELDTLSQVIGTLALAGSSPATSRSAATRPPIRGRLRGHE